MSKHDRRLLPVDGTDPHSWLTVEDWRAGRRGAPRLPTPPTPAAPVSPPAAPRRSPHAADPALSAEAVEIARVLGIDPEVLRTYTGATPDLPHVSREEVLQALRLPPAEMAALLKRMQED
jgi:hypothetical protein